MASVHTIIKILGSKWKCPLNSPMIQSRAKYSILVQEKRQSIKSNRLGKNVLVLACNKAQINLHKFQSRQLSLSVAFASNTLVSLHYSLLLNNTKSGYFTSNLPFSLHSVAGALEQSLDGRKLSTSAAARIKGTANTNRDSNFFLWPVHCASLTY